MQSYSFRIPHAITNGRAPQVGATVVPQSRLPTASTLSEENTSVKVGSVAVEGLNATIEPPDDMTNNQGNHNPEGKIEPVSPDLTFAQWIVGDCSDFGHPEKSLTH
jgi:hypothetical protein